MEIRVGSFAHFTIMWRRRKTFFRVYELQAFLVEMISKFEYSLAIPAEKICREPCGVMVPTIVGENEKGSQLPVHIKIATRGD